MTQHQAPNTGIVTQEVDTITQATIDILEGKLEGIQNYLDSGGSPNATNYSSTPLLELSILSNRQEISQLLLERGARPIYGRPVITPKPPLRDLQLPPVPRVKRKKVTTRWVKNKSIQLQEAIRSRNEAKARELAWSAISSESRRGESLIMQATRQGLGELVKTLITAGADPDARDETGRNALMVAVSAIPDNPLYESQLRIARIIANSGLTDLNDTDDENRTALMHAVINGNKRSVLDLLVLGASIEVPDSHGLTPLEYAQINGPKNIAILLEHHRKSRTPSEEEKAKNLREKSHLTQNINQCGDTVTKGVNPNHIFDINSDIPPTPLLHYATEAQMNTNDAMNDHQRESLITKIIKAGGDPNITDAEGNTPLMRAIPKNDLYNYAWTEFLNHDINAQEPGALNNDGETVAMHAARSDIRDTDFRSFVDFFNNVEAFTVLNKEGQSAIQILQSTNSAVYNRVLDALEEGLPDSVAKRNSLMQMLNYSKFGHDKFSTKNLLPASAWGANDTWGPVHQGAYTGNMQIIQHYLKKNLKIFFENSKSGSGLAVAIRTGNKEAAKQLIDALAKSAHITEVGPKRPKIDLTIDTGDNNGDTALTWAARLNIPDMAQYLIENGASVERKNSMGQSFLTLAAQSRNPELIQHATKAVKSRLINKNIKLSKLSLEFQILADAIRDHDTETMFRIIQSGIDINAVYEDGSTALLIAIIEGSLESVKILVESGAKISRVDKECRSGIRIARRYGRDEIKSYLEKQDKVKKETQPIPAHQPKEEHIDSESSPSEYEFDSEDSDIDSESSPSEYEFDSEDSEDRERKIFSYRRNELETEGRILKSFSKDPVKLHMARINGHWQAIPSECYNKPAADLRKSIYAALAKFEEDGKGVLKTFLETGVIDEQEKANTIAWASHRGLCPGAVKLLLEYGANPNTVTTNGNPLLVEISGFESFAPRNNRSDAENREEIAEILLKSGANPNLRDRPGNETALMLTRNPNITKLLLEYGASTELTSDRRTALEYAIEHKHPIEIIDILSRHVPSIAQISDDRLHRTVTDRVVSSNNIQCAEQILANDRPWAINAPEFRNGHTPLHEAKTPEMVEILLKHGAKINALDRAGYTPLGYALSIYRENLPLARCLLEHGASPTFGNPSPIELLRHMQANTSRHAVKQECHSLLQECLKRLPLENHREKPLPKTRDDTQSYKASEDDEISTDDEASNDGTVITGGNRQLLAIQKQIEKIQRDISTWKKKASSPLAQLTLAPDVESTLHTNIRNAIHNGDMMAMREACEVIPGDDHPIVKAVAANSLFAVQVITSGRYSAKANKSSPFGARNLDKSDKNRETDTDPSTSKKSEGKKTEPIRPDTKDQEGQNLDTSDKNRETDTGPSTSKKSEGKKTGPIKLNTKDPEEQKVVKSNLKRLLTQIRAREDAKAQEVAFSPPKPQHLEKALFLAIYKNQAKMVGYLLKNIDKFNAHGETPLIAAARSKEPEIVDLILDCGADVNAIGIGRSGTIGETALIHAIRAQNPKIVKKLLKQGARVDSCDRNGNPALLLATLLNQVEIVESLLQYEADPLCQSKEAPTPGLTPVACALALDNQEICRLFHKAKTKAKSEPKMELDIHSMVRMGMLTGRNSRTRSAKSIREQEVPEAARNKNIEQLIELLEFSVAATVPEEDNVLVMAVLANSPEAVDLILSEPEKIIRDEGGEVEVPNLETAMIRAVILGNPEIISILARHLSHLQSGTLLTLAIRHSNTEALETLLDLGANPNMPDTSLTTPLILAAGSSPKLIETLLRHGAKINEIGKDGKTALLCAVLSGQLEAVDTLLKHGAKMDMMDEHGVTHFEIAIRTAQDYKHVKMEKLLRNYQPGRRTEVPQEPTTSEQGNPGPSSANTSPDISPLIVATERGDAQAVENILQRGECLEDLDKALLWATKSGWFEISTLLLNQTNSESMHTDTPITEYTDETGNTPLLLATSETSRDVFALVQVLIACHANINARNICNDTALMYAAKANQLKAVELLIAAGADINARNTSGESALVYAAGQGNQEIVTLLLDNGARIDLDTAPLQLAITNGVDLHSREESGESNGLTSEKEYLGTITTLLGRCTANNLEAHTAHALDTIEQQTLHLNQENREVPEEFILAMHLAIQSLEQTPEEYPKSDTSEPLPPTPESPSAESEANQSITEKLISAIKNNSHLAEVTSLVNTLESDQASETEKAEPLLLAIEMGRMDALNAILGTQSNQKLATPEGQKALVLAIESNNIEAATALTSQGATLDPNYASSLLADALKAKNSQAAAFLAKLSTPSLGAIQDAILHNSHEALKELLVSSEPLLDKSSRANLWTRVNGEGIDNDTKNTIRQALKKSYATVYPIHDLLYKTKSESPEELQNLRTTLSDLLKQNQSITEADEYGIIPLGIAIARNQAEVVSIIIENGASVEDCLTENDIQNLKQNQLQALEAPTLGGIPVQDPRHTLLELYICLKANRWEIENPLHWAVNKGKNKLIKLLLKHGYNPVEVQTCQVKDGHVTKIPLQVAIAKNKIQTAQTLLECQARYIKGQATFMSEGSGALERGTALDTMAAQHEQSLNRPSGFKTLLLTMLSQGFVLANRPQEVLSLCNKCQLFNEASGLKRFIRLTRLTPEGSRGYRSHHFKDEAGRLLKQNSGALSSKFGEMPKIKKVLIEIQNTYSRNPDAIEIRKVENDTSADLNSTETRGKSSRPQSARRRQAPSPSLGTQESGQSSQSKLGQPPSRIDTSGKQNTSALERHQAQQEEKKSEPRIQK